MTSVHLTWRDIVRLIGRRYFGVDLTDDEIDWVLWERTPFPMGGYDLVTAALWEHFAYDETGVVLDLRRATTPNREGSGAVAGGGY